MIAQHHEMADGSRASEQAQSSIACTPAARIVALVNRYDNLCDPALPAHALTPHEALSLIFAQTRSKFDASMLNAFIRMMGVYPPGSVVQLTDDRFALVTNVNSTRPLKPRVLVFDPLMPADEALHLEPGAARRSGHPPQPARAAAARRRPALPGAATTGDLLLRARACRRGRTSVGRSLREPPRPELTADCRLGWRCCTR